MQNIFQNMILFTKNRYYFQIVTMLLFASLGFGQVSFIIDTIDVNTINLHVEYEGDIKNGIQWKDGGVDNIVIISETGSFQSDKFNHEYEGLDAELFAYHFSRVNDEYQLIWKVYDFISDCPVDIEATFIKNTLQVTDLNKNGIAEIWLMYKTACRGDVSPSDMKVIMYEGLKKYAMRGQNIVQLSEEEMYGGEYTFDNAFNSGPKDFRVFAKSLWDKNILQVWAE